MFILSQLDIVAKPYHDGLKIIGKSISCRDTLSVKDRTAFFAYGIFQLIPVINASNYGTKLFVKSNFLKACNELKNDPLKLEEIINRYKIIDLQQIYEFLKIGAENPSGVTQNYFKIFKQANLSQNHRFEIAKCVVSKRLDFLLERGCVFFEIIGSFGPLFLTIIKDLNLTQDQVFEILKNCLLKDSLKKENLQESDSALNDINRFLADISESKFFNKDQLFEVIKIVTKKIVDCGDFPSNFGSHSFVKFKDILINQLEPEQVFVIVKIIASTVEHFEPELVCKFGLLYMDGVKIANIRLHKFGEFSGGYKRSFGEVMRQEYEIFAMAQFGVVPYYFNDELYPWTRFVHEPHDLVKRLQAKDRLDGGTLPPIDPSLKPMIDEVLKIENELIRNNLIKWISYTEAKFALRSEKDEFRKLSMPFIEEIFSACRIQEMRCHLTDYLVDRVWPMNGSIHHNPLAPLQRRNTRLFELLLTPFIPLMNPLSDDITIVLRSFSSRDFRNGELYNDTVNGLLNLIDEPFLNEKEKWNLIKSICRQYGSNGRNILKHLTAIGALFRMSPSVAILEKMKTENDISIIQKILEKVFVERTGISHIANFGDKFKRILANPKAFDALLVYSSRLASLTGKIKDRAKKSFSLFVESVLNGNFNQGYLGNEPLSSVRYDLSRNLHLETIFAKHPKQFPSWQKGAKIPLSQFLNDHNHQAAKFDPVAFLHTKICADKHLDLVKFQDIAASLKDMKLYPSLAAKWEAKYAEIKQISRLPKEESKEDSKEESQLDICLAHVQLFAILSEKILVQKKLEKISGLITTFKNLYGDAHQFIVDLQELKKQINPSQRKLNFDHWTVEDTDNWEDMILLGIAGSCQNVNREVKYNICLLAYLLDGKNRAVVIKNENGEIVARCIMRILWDPILEMPVIYKEKLYALPGLPKAAESGMDYIFIEKAKLLGIPCVCTSTEIPNAFYPNALQSLGGPAPSEYVDAGKLGRVDGCVYTIPNDHIEYLYNPRG